MNSNEKEDRYRVVKYRLVMILLVISFICFLFFEANKTIKMNAYSNFTTNIKQNTLNDYISYSINGSTSQNIPMSDVRFIPLEKDDLMTITINIDKSYDENNVLLIMAEYCMIDAYVDDELIYTYGHNLYQIGDCLAGGYYKIPIKNEYVGKEMKIKFIATEPNKIAGLEDISMESNDNIINSFVTKNLLIICVALPLFVFGVVLFILSLLKIIINSEVRQLCWIAPVYIFVSIWLLAHYKIFQIWSNDLRLINSIEYFSFYVGSIPFLIFFREFITGKVYKKISSILIGVLVIFDIVAVFMHFADIAHYAALLPIFHIIVAINIIYLVVYSIIKRDKIKKDIDISFLFSMFFVVFIITLEVIRYYFYGIFKWPILSYSLMPAAIIFFVLSMVYKYIIGMLRKIYKKGEQENLLDLAFTDQLTQVPNRTKCEEYMRTLSGKINESYTVINLDLNNLKYVNDTFGHHIGDEMIYAGAQIIKDTFSIYGQVGRMGGDEFIAIITITDKGEIEKLLKDLNNKINGYNRENSKEFTLSIAYGYAIKVKNSTESIWKIYEEADKVMYECKKKQKEKLNIKR